jgi:hypothetical protein
LFANFIQNGSEFIVIARSEATRQSSVAQTNSGLPRYARNDENADVVDLDWTGQLQNYQPTLEQRY